MSCRFEDNVTGTCQLFNPGIETPACDENGVCVVSDDECPSGMCNQYFCEDCSDEECYCHPYRVDEDDNLCSFCTEESCENCPDE
jgi:hypothetical protein